jgi:hypothetical protein
MSVFSVEQVATLRAAVDRIIPADDFPSGWEAGVGDYLMRQLASGDLKHRVNLYREGLNGLDAEACALFNRHFVDLQTDEQDELLGRVERLVVETVWSVSPAGFLTLLIEHCMEGYYSDPGNGGNRGGVSWAMIGFEVRG